MPSQDEMEAALAAVRSMGIGADKMSDELICEELQYNDWNQHQVVQNYYDGVYGGDSAAAGQDGIGIEMVRRSSDIAVPPPPPPRRDPPPPPSRREAPKQPEGSYEHERTHDGDVDSVWSMSGVCEDIGECCEDEVKGCCCITWFCMVLILIIILLSCSLETIDSTKQGIVYNTPQAILGASISSEGLHFKPPFGEFLLWPVLTTTISEKLNCLSSDGVTITATIAYQFTVDSTYLRQLTLDYRTYDNWLGFVKIKSRSGIRNACAMHTAKQYQEQRGQVQIDMFAQLKLRLQNGNMRANLLDLQLTQVDRPVSYEAAVDAKESAKNYIAQATNNRAQAITIAETELLKIEIDANKTLNTAATQKSITEKNAEAEAAVVYGRYVSQAQTYYTVRSNRSMTSEGLLAYISTRLIDELGNMTVGLEAPATMSYKDEL